MDIDLSNNKFVACRIPMMKIYSLSRVLVQSALWLILWTILIAQLIGRLVSSTFKYAILYFGMLLILQYNILQGHTRRTAFL